MNSNVEYILKLLHSVLYDEPAPIPDDDMDWLSALSVAGMGEVHTIIYKKISELPKEKQPDDGLMGWLREQTFRIGMEKLQFYDLVSRILKEAKKQGIQVVLFKGPVVADLYPEPMLRKSCDMDMYVDPKSLKAFEKILVDFHFEKNIEHSKDVVPVYVLNKKFMIEAHCCLFEDYEGKRIEMLKEMDLTNKDRLVELSVSGLDITTMGHEDHLVFLLFHLIKHITYSGCSLKTIIDIALFVNAYGDQINKASFWEKMKMLGYENFCCTLFSICVRYFGMKKDFLLDDTYSDSVAEVSLARMYEVGILKDGASDQGEDRRAYSIVYQSLQGKEDKKISKIRMWKKTFFPGHKDLSFRYMYARKHPSLVWIAWIHRGFNQLSVFFVKDKAQAANVSKDMKLANRKLALMKELDLMNKD